MFRYNISIFLNTKGEVMLKEITVASAVVALLVLSGCGGGPSNPTKGTTPPDTGIVIPDALNQKADLNDSTAGSIMRNFYGKNINNSSIASIKSNFLAKDLQNIKIASQPANDDGHEAESGPCNEGGTFSFTRDVIKTTEGDMNVTTTIINCSANNCKINGSVEDYMDYCKPQEANEYYITSKPQVDDSIRFYNGSSKLELKESVSANMASYPRKHIFELTLKVSNLTYTKSSDSSALEEYKFANGDINTKTVETRENNVSSELEWTWNTDYLYKNYDRNKTNHAQIDGGISSKNTLNWIWTRENNATGQKEIFNGDGYVLSYDISGSEDNKTLNHYSGAYDNVTFEKGKEGNVTTLSINGGVSSSYSCWKMVYFTTDKLVKHNREFKDRNGHNEENLLPYDGKVTLKANGTAESTFDVDDSNITSMTLKVNGTEAENSPYKGWNEVPTYDCGED